MVPKVGQLVLGLCILTALVTLLIKMDRLQNFVWWRPRTNVSSNCVEPKTKPEDADRIVNRTDGPAEATKGGNDTAIARPTPTMTLVFVICESHYWIGLVAIKSAVAYSTTPMHLIIVADDQNREKLQKEIASWPKSVRERVKCDVLPVWYPRENYYVWWSMFRPCATQRLFLPSILPKKDAVIYADTDVLFLNPVEDFWRMFAAMNEFQMAAMAPETEDRVNNMYWKTAHRPFVQPFAANAGLLMMNLTRMRKFGLERRVEELRREFQGQLPWADQDLLNILFARHPLGLFTFTCRWNYRSEHCTGDGLCADGPVAVLHGSRRAFLWHEEPGFTAVHKTMQQYKLGERLVDTFIVPLKRRLSELNNTQCVEEFNRQIDLWELNALRVDNASFVRSHWNTSTQR